MCRRRRRWCMYLAFCHNKLAHTNIIPRFTEPVWVCEIKRRLRRNRFEQERAFYGRTGSGSLDPRLMTTTTAIRRSEGPAATVLFFKKSSQPRKISGAAELWLFLYIAVVVVGHLGREKNGHLYDIRTYVLILYLTGLLTYLNIDKHVVCAHLCICCA